jgi:hypothetical protein
MTLALSLGYSGSFVRSRRPISCSAASRTLSTSLIEGNDLAAHSRAVRIPEVAPVWWTPDYLCSRSPPNRGNFIQNPELGI